METENIKIGIITISTGDRYIQLSKKLLTSIDKFFCTNTQKQICVITDTPTEYINLNTHQIINLPSPLITLLRFNFINQIKHVFDSVNYIYYIDSDCEVVQNIELSDIIPDTIDQYVVTRHPWAVSDQNEWILENNPKSEAYIKNVKDYFQGSFYGASRSEFFKMSDILQKQVEIDLKNRIITKWFDESYFNKYMSDKNYKVLSAIEYSQPTKHVILSSTKIHHINAHTC
jgi:hypothetical protein